MMNEAPDTANNDPLGYQRFALTESAYDLINSLIGFYFRLIFSEEKRTTPDETAITKWKNRADELQDLVHTNDWSNLSLLKQMISDLTAEYEDHTSLELNGQSTNAQPNPKPVSVV